MLFDAAAGEGPEGTKALPALGDAAAPGWNRTGPPTVDWLGRLAGGGGTPPPPAPATDIRGPCPGALDIEMRGAACPTALLVETRAPCTREWVTNGSRRAYVSQATTQRERQHNNGGA